MFTLDDHVDMPSRRNRYPFEQMTKGQSFEIVGAEDARKVRNAAYQYAKKANTEGAHAKGSEGEVKFALRKTGEIAAVAPATEATKVYRLWRE